jgi:hypothetical protein
MADAKETSQVERFRELASKIGCDEDRGQFEAQLARIAAHKPEPKPAQKKKRRTKKSIRTEGKSGGL